jgi:uncharacterized coiled-coil DUF342 family protein
MSLYDRTRKLLRARRNKLEAEVRVLRSTRDVLNEHLQQRIKDLHKVRTEQDSLDLEESVDG